jgi:ATP-binding cassette subfamily C protein LapB
MDRNLEQQVTQALKSAIGTTDTLVLVTHKAEMFALVDRLIVIVNQQVVIDGPKAQVLQKLQSPPSPQAGDHDKPQPGPQPLQRYLA